VDHVWPRSTVDHGGATKSTAAWPLECNVQALWLTGGCHEGRGRERGMWWCRGCPHWRGSGGEAAR
jgi:hypothetical protein